MPHINNHSQVSTRLWGLGLAGALLLAFPATALGLQHNRLTTGTPLRLNVEKIQIIENGIVPQYSISTPLNRISTSQLTGDNSFVVNDQVFVFMSPGPQDIWYPYAISKRPPEPGCHKGKCLVLKGRVTDIARDSLKIAYAFENLIKTVNFRDIDINHRKREIEIQIDESGNTVLKTLRIGDHKTDQRNLFSWNPPGSINLGANIAPATNPPK